MLLAAVIVLGTRFVPRLLYAVARTGSRELFLLTVVLIALGTALASHEAGLSFALGAFLAGIVVSESEFDSQVLAEIIPLRDLFATLFFVAVGMLLEPGFVSTTPARSCWSDRRRWSSANCSSPAAPTWPPASTTGRRRWRRS